MKTLRRWILRLSGIIALLLLALFILKKKADRDFYHAYSSEPPLNARILSDHTDASIHSQQSVFDGVEKISVPLVSYYPIGKEQTKLPCVIFLHGIGQSKSFLKLIAPYFTSRGYAIVCFDQYTRGERRLPSDSNDIEKGLAMRRRAALTVMETRRLVDYLQSKPEIDPQKIYLVGASFGAIMGTIVAAQEPRISATALIYGGGGWGNLTDSPVIRKELGSWTAPAALLTAFIMSPAEPLLYADQLTRRPLLIQNGTHDSIIPTVAAKALINTAGDHATVIWYDSDHVGLDKKHVEVVLKDVITWLDQVNQ